MTQFLHSEVEEFYVRYCIPRKIELNLAYARRANVWEDTKIILRTLYPRLLKGSAQANGSRLPRNASGERSPGAGRCSLP